MSAPIAAAQRASRIRRNDLRARRRGPIHRTPHRSRASNAPRAARGEGHHLHRRELTPTRCPWLRPDERPTATLGSFLGSASMLVIGAGATGVQVTSIFNAFGSQVHLVDVAPRILTSEDDDVSAAVSAAPATPAILSLRDAGRIDRLEPSRAGVRLLLNRAVRASMHRRHLGRGRGRLGGEHGRARPSTGPASHTNQRGYVDVDACSRTTAPHIFAAGDVTGRPMVVHEAARQAFRSPRPTPYWETPAPSCPRR